MTDILLPARSFRRLPRALRTIWQSLAAALFPARCPACKQLFHDSNPAASASHETKMPLGQAFCPDCRQRWTAVSSPLCSRCGLVFTSRAGEDHLCGRCLKQPGAFGRARAVGIYDQSLRVAIQALKFKGRVELAEPLGRLLWDTYGRHWPAGAIDVVAPVPLHRRRRRQRGFNQAHLLIRKWALSDSTVMIPDLLVRQRETPPQTGLDRRQRRKNIAGAFVVDRPQACRDKRILLVDDVLTTGATVEACARVLLAAGAQRVDVLTLARA